MKDSLIIIGGGAAGLCAAVAVKQKCPSMSVRILEALPRVGKKLSVTGNGRCNITNKNITLDRYYGKNTELAEYVLEKYDNAVIEDFFEKIGVDFVYEGDKAYPSSLQAGSVVDCLRFAADELGVITCTDTKVTNIQLSKDGYKIISDKMNFYADKLLVATGLLSGGEKYGCDGYIFELLKKSGFSANALNPAIVQVKTENEIVKQLKGIKIDAAVSLKSNGNIVRKDRGEVLFCDYGLSGPPVMQVSGAISQIKGQSAIYLDILPDMSYDSLYEKLKTRAKSERSQS